MKDLRGRRVVVVGMERSGLAVVDFLLTREASVLAVDSKPIEELPQAGDFLKRWGVEFARQSPDVFDRAELIVLSPGVPADLDEIEAARRGGVEVIGEVELAGAFIRGRIAGITGSNGKTTTTALVGHILREAGIACQIGGNIGTAVTAMIKTSRADQWNVLELSSFQLETIRTFRADVAVCLNVTPDHLDRHRTFERYAAAKGRLFETQLSGDSAVLNADDATCVGYSGGMRSAPVWFSLTRAVTPGVWLDQDDVVRSGDQAVIAAKDIPIRGRHNVENTMAAIACSRLAGAPLEAIAAAIRTFRAVEHRLEFVRALRGVEYYNDSKATNVDATLKALDAFDGGLWVILGGKDKGSDYSVLREPLRKKARAVLLIGAAAPKIAAQIDGSVALVDAGTIEAAVAEAHRGASAGDTVLLAPACASFDQFRSYEHRGSVFKSLVAALKEDE